MKDVVRGFDYEKAIEKDLGVTIKKLGEDWQRRPEEGLRAGGQGHPQAGRPGQASSAGQPGRPLQHRPGPEPRRQALPVHLLARPLLHRHVHGRRQDRQGDPQDHLDRRRSRTSRASSSSTRPGPGTPGATASSSAPSAPASPSWPSSTPTAAGSARRSASPSWARSSTRPGRPTGSRIAFSALTGGTSDLHLYDLESKTLKPLTSDVFGDLQPAWSPDGRWIAFVTERFNSDLSILNVGEHPAGPARPRRRARSSRWAASCSGKVINPQWSSDSKSVFFVSDRDGISNVYRVDVATGEPSSRSPTSTPGVSGITSLSPSLSIASKSNDVLYSVYQDGNYSIFSIDPASLAGTPVQDVEVVARRRPSCRPRSGPAPRSSACSATRCSACPTRARSPASLTSPRSASTTSRRPTIGVSVGRYGTYAGGGSGLPVQRYARLPHHRGPGPDLQPDHRFGLPGGLLQHHPSD